MGFLQHPDQRLAAVRQADVLALLLDVPPADEAAVCLKVDVQLLTAQVIQEASNRALGWVQSPLQLQHLSLRNLVAEGLLAVVIADAAEQAGLRIGGVRSGRRQRLLRVKAHDAVCFFTVLQLADDFQSV